MTSRRTKLVVMEGATRARFAWPPRTCAAAFVSAALKELGGWEPDRAALARALRTRVAPDDENPWDLPISEDPDRVGALREDVEVAMPAVLSQFSSGLGFRHVPFNTVAFRAFSSVLDEARAGGCVVGVGFNPVRIGWGGGKHRHVARAEPGLGLEDVMLYDDCGGEAEGEEIRWELLEAATFEIGDGFWIVGPRESLALGLTLPVSLECRYEARDRVR